MTMKTAVKIRDVENGIGHLTIHRGTRIPTGARDVGMRDIITMNVSTQIPPGSTKKAAIIGKAAGIANATGIDLAHQTPTAIKAASGLVNVTVVSTTLLIPHMKSHNQRWLPTHLCMQRVWLERQNIAG
jgi:hypothetical protein